MMAAKVSIVLCCLFIITQLAECRAPFRRRQNSVHRPLKKIQEKTEKGNGLPEINNAGVPHRSMQCVCATPPAAVYAARTTNHSLVGRVHYPDLVIQTGNAWNDQQSILTVPAKSIYFFQVTAGAQGGRRISLTLSGVPTPITAVRNSTSHLGTDIISRHFIYRMNTDDQVSVENGHSSFLYSQGERQTSFLAFDLQSYMHPSNQIIFSTARDSLYANVGQMPFQNIFLNEGGAFDESDKRLFNVQRSGIYFFCLSVGVPTRLNVRAQIKRTSSPNNPLAELWRSSDTHNAPDIISIAVMANLQSGDSVYVELMDGEIYSDAGHPTFFGGFYYNPYTGPQMAWSVYSNTKYVAYDTPLDPMPFDGAWVNTNDMYDFSDQKVHIITSGIYYISLSVGVQAGSKMDVTVVLDRHRVEAAIYRTSQTHFAEDAMNQGLLLRLSAGNTIRVVLGPNSESHSDGDHQTVFTGFLLQNDETYN